MNTQQPADKAFFTKCTKINRPKVWAAEIWDEFQKQNLNLISFFQSKLWLLMEPILELKWWEEGWTDFQGHMDYTSCYTNQL